jgi:hypothetical protein
LCALYILSFFFLFLFLLFLLPLSLCPPPSFPPPPSSNDDNPSEDSGSGECTENAPLLPLLTIKVLYKSSKSMIALEGEARFKRKFC